MPQPEVRQKLGRNQIPVMVRSHPVCLHDLMPLTLPAGAV